MNAADGSTLGVKSLGFTSRGMTALPSALHLEVSWYITACN